MLRIKGCFPNSKQMAKEETNNLLAFFLPVKRQETTRIDGLVTDYRNVKEGLAVKAQRSSWPFQELGYGGEKVIKLLEQLVKWGEVDRSGEVGGRHKCPRKG